MMQLRVVYREPGILFWGFAFPLLIAFILGIAFENRPSMKRTVAFISGNSPEQTKSSAAWIEKLRKVPEVEIRQMSEQEAGIALKKGIIQIIVRENSGKGLRFAYDPASQEAENLYLKLEKSLDPGRTQLARQEKITTSGSRYIDYLAPGLMAMSIMNSCLWGIAWYLVDLRIKKLLRVMVATPMRKSEFLLSFFITRILLTSIEALLLFSFARWYFGVVMTGSFAALALIMAAGNAAFSGIAVCAASRAASSQVGDRKSVV